MTVLGKVPKPINLPSQKLENHGLDPNVEIVPKGAHTWGSRPMLASSSAWGSSTLSSPRADGSLGSSTHANGRPLSGGSGTRPSTGSSERSSEPSAMSWGPSSRPSSASGIVPTSHVLVASNRPRSAETRPNSSQLSRFAEGSADSISWGAAGTSEKVAAEASKRSDFTLSSGDFPTLGSEKSDEPKSLPGRSPKVRASESGLLSSFKGTSESLLNSGNGNPGPMLQENFNSWSADGNSHIGAEASTRAENWHKDIHNSQHLLDANMPAQQFASWRGPPGHPPNVIWYGGHEAGPPYRPFGPPGSYHVDPYYPYVSAGAVPNTQAFSRPEVIPGGMHFKMGESYRHMPPESYIAHSQPGMPVRPGVYSGPLLYEGFHIPPRPSFGSSSEQDVPTIGMSDQYGVNNQHLPDNFRLQPWRFQAQHDGSTPAMAKQQMISDQANETQGHYKVLLKQHGDQEEKEHTVTVWPTAQRGMQPGSSTAEVNLVNCYEQEQTTDKHHVEISHSQHANDLVDHSNRNSLGTSKPTVHNVIKKLNNASVHTRDQHNILKKNASLMEKVECLNSKTHVVDAHFDCENFPSKEKMDNHQNLTSNAEHLENIHQVDSRSASNIPNSGPNMGTNQLNTSTKVIIHESVIELKPTLHQSDDLAVVSDKSNCSEYGRHSQSHNQKRALNTKAKVHHHYGKLKFGSYGADEMNDTPERDPLEKTSVASGISGYLISMPGSHGSQEVHENQDSHLVFKSMGEPSSLEPVADDVQHAQLKVLARQRAIELKQKEAERTAELKAKAMAKLDELNRRTSNSNQNLRNVPPLCNDILNIHDTKSGTEAKSSAAINETSPGSLSCDFQAKSQANSDSIIKHGDPAVSSVAQPSRTSGFSDHDCLSLGEQSCPLGQETTEINTGKTVSDLQDGVVSKRKQAGLRRRKNITDERSQSERKANSDSCENTRLASMVIEDSSDGLGTLNSEDSTFHSSNKNNRGSKYKNKLSDTLLSSPLASSKNFEGASDKHVMDHNETKLRENLIEAKPVLEKNSIEIMGGQDSFDSTVAPNQAMSELTKAAPERASNNWKPHPHRKTGRNLQTDKTIAKHQGSENVVWAPVKPVIKNGSSEQVHKSSTSQLTNPSDMKNGQDVHNGAKARRAEMERYVPKPIAKELSLQGDSHQHSSPPSSTTSIANMTGKLDSASARAVTGRDVISAVPKSAMTSMNTEDAKQSKQGKTRASWRQRNPLEHEQRAVEGSISFNSSKCVEKASELQHSKSGDDLHVEGGNVVLDETLMTTLSNANNHGANMQRRQQYKEHRIDRSSYAPTHSKVVQSEMPDKREIMSPGPLAESVERNHLRNENQSAGSGQMRSHWQPKSQVHPHHYLDGYKNSGGHRVADKSLPSETAGKNLDGSDSAVQRNKFESDNAKYRDNYTERKVSTNDKKIQEVVKERKAMKQPSKNENDSVDRDFTGITDAGASANANSYPDHSGAHRHGHIRGQASKTSDATYERSQKVHSTPDTRNIEQHFEYQTGFPKDSDMFQQNSGASEEVADARRVSSGVRYGVQGRNHSRRGGHFYGPRRSQGSGAYDVGG